MDGNPAQYQHFAVQHHHFTQQHATYASLRLGHICEQRSLHFHNHLIVELVASLTKA